MCNIAFNVVSMYAPSSFYDSEELQITQKQTLFLKKIVHDFGRENKRE